MSVSSRSLCGGYRVAFCLYPFDFLDYPNFIFYFLFASLAVLDQNPPIHGRRQRTPHEIAENMKKVLDYKCDIQLNRVCLFARWVAFEEGNPT